MNEGYKVGFVSCTHCGKVWVAVRPAEINDNILICPECGKRNIEKEKEMKKRLIELIKNAPRFTFAVGGRLQGRTYKTVSNIADYLLANGVIAPPCRVGDVLYYLADLRDELIIDEIRVTEVGTKRIFASAYKDVEDDIQDVYFFSDLGKTLFFTREEAEKKLRGIMRRRNNEEEAD